MSTGSQYLEAKTLLTPYWEEVRIILVGCGGTGSHTAYAISRLMVAVEAIGKKATAIFVDPDVVETKNLGRQLFTYADLGKNKALVLATRLNLSLGLNISVVPHKFNAEMVDYVSDKTLVVLVGCVDNAEARCAISQTLEGNSRYVRYSSDLSTIAPRIYWLDGGNEEHSGQVLVGCINEQELLTSVAFPEPEVCVALPSPSLQHPELLIPSVSSTVNTLSCAEMALQNTQSLSVNAHVAAWINEYLRQLLFGGLRKYATYFDLASGSCQSVYITKVLA
ncbi:MAG TPA: ThiF family adenylyltransferase [Nostocaceae cyanobacterium]|nr:ThiF family adenylyltransferase [Nostocaceae cyanobacterium]